MKKIIFAFILVLISIASFSQSLLPRSTNTSNTLVDYRDMIQYNLFIPRYYDTTAANIQKGVDSAGAIIKTYSPDALWIRKSFPSKFWDRVTTTELDPLLSGYISNGFTHDLYPSSLYQYSLGSVNKPWDKLHVGDIFLYNYSNLAPVNKALSTDATGQLISYNVDSLISLRNPMPPGSKNQVAFSLGNNTNKYRSGDPMNVGRRYVLNDVQLADAKTSFTSFKTIFDTWNRFSSYATTPNPYDAEKNTWIYNDTTQTILTTLNSNSYIGFYSPKAYKDYTVTGTMSASNQDVLHDNDIITFVIAVAMGTDGKLHTISLVCMRNMQPEYTDNGTFIRYSIVYDLATTHYKVLANGDNLVWNTTNAWDNHERDFKVVRAGDNITTLISEYDDAPGGKGALRFPLTFSLANFEETQIFRSGASYGFGALSQANATFKNVVTNVSEDAVYDLRRPFNVWLPSSGGSYAIDTSAHFEHTRQWFYNPLYKFTAYIDGGDSLNIIANGNADSLNHFSANHFASASSVVDSSTAVRTAVATVQNNVNTESTARINGDISLQNLKLNKDSAFATSSMGLTTTSYSLTSVSPNLAGGNESQGNARDSLGNIYFIGTTFIKKFDSLYNQVAINTTPFSGTSHTFVHFNDGKVYKGKLYIPTFALAPTYYTALLVYNLDLSFFAEYHIDLEDKGISAMTIVNDTICIASFEQPPANIISLFGFQNADNPPYLGSYTFAQFADINRVQGIDAIDDKLILATDFGQLAMIDRKDGANFKTLYTFPRQPWIMNAEGIDVNNNNILWNIDSTGVGTRSNIYTLKTNALHKVVSADNKGSVNINGITKFSNNVSVAGNISVLQKGRLQFSVSDSLKPDFYMYQPDRVGRLDMVDSTGTAIFTIKQGGNVGLSTTAPITRFEALGGGAKLLSTTGFYNVAALQDHIKFRGLLMGYDTSGQIGLIMSGSPAASTKSQTAFWGSDGTTFREMMRLSGDGKFGIGTTTPGASTGVDTKLHIVGTTAGSAGRTEARVKNTSTTAGSLITAENDLGNSVTLSSFGSVFGSGLSDLQGILSTGSVVIAGNSNTTSGGTTSISYRPGGFGTAAETVRFLGDGRVGIGTTTPNASAILDITSTNKGILVPRVTSTQRDAISGVDGLIVFNTDQGRLNIYSTALSAWRSVMSDGVTTKTYAATTNIDFNTARMQTVSLTGDVTFTTSNIRSGSEVIIRVVSDASIRNLTFPAGWTFMTNAAPTSIAASKTGLLILRSFGTTDANIIATWAVQP